jgi:hypothetical protein
MVLLSDTPRQRDLRIHQRDRPLQFPLQLLHRAGFFDKTILLPQSSLLVLAK